MNTLTHTPAPRRAAGAWFAAILLTLAVAAGVVRAEVERIVLLPDTQKYAESWPEIFASQTQWIADHAASLNIRFVSHLGDLVENGAYDTHSPANADEWNAANAAMSRLDGVVPYGMVIGNHDFDNWYDPQAGSSQFLSRFGPSRYAGQSWYGGASPDGLSSVQRFTLAGREMLILHLKPDLAGDTLAWAQGVLDANPDTPAMISTHIYMKESGRTQYGYMDFYDHTGTWNGHSGEEIFQQLVAVNPQVFMVNCGHVSAELFQTSLNAAGQEVFELLQDYQNRDLGGAGYLRILEFDEAAGEIRALTYSPWLDAYETDADSQFTIPVDFNERFGTIPEPSALCLLALGAAAIRRRRRH